MSASNHNTDVLSEVYNIAEIDTHSQQQIKKCFVRLTKMKLAVKQSLASDSVDQAPLRRSQRLHDAVVRSSIPKPILNAEISIRNSSKQIVTPTQMSNILWKELISRNNDIAVGMIVCAKMATYWPWPAQLLSFKGKKARIRFFGDYREGTVDKIQCVPYIHCHSLIFNYIRTIEPLKRKAWIKDLDEIADVSKRRQQIAGFQIKKIFMQAVMWKSI